MGCPLRPDSGLQYLSTDEHIVAWADFLNRSDRISAIRRYLSSAPQAINFHKFQRVLSIGPGEGDPDVSLVSMCPHVEEYVLVEPNVAGLNVAIGKMEKAYAHVKVTGFYDIFERFHQESSETEFDAIFVCHSLYRMWEEREATMAAILSRLAPGGQVVILIDHGHMNYLANNTFPENIPDTIRDVLQRMKLRYHEEEAEPTQFNIGGEGGGYYGFIDILAMHKLPIDQKERILREMQQDSMTEGEIMREKQTVFVINKSKKE